MFDILTCVLVTSTPACDIHDALRPTARQLWLDWVASIRPEAIMRIFVSTGVLNSARWSLLTLSACMLLTASRASLAEASFLQNGHAGFVVSGMKYVLAGDAQSTGACPNGLSRHVADIFAMSPQGKRRKGESDEQYAARQNEGAKQLSTAPNGENLCMNPEAGKPDPYFRAIQSADVPGEGIDLEAAFPRSRAASLLQTCPHPQLVSKTGERSIDNQFARVVGCIPSFQSTGQSNGFDTEMLTGSWGILITLSGVDDIQNDDSVEVGLFANGDPIQLSPARKPLAYATYTIDQDPRFRAKTTGRIKDGVLTTEPVDVRFHSITNGMRFERPLVHARLEARISGDGVLDAYLAGYTPIDAMYNFQFGYRNGRDRKGDLAPLPLRLGTGNGAARVLGYTCPGIYFALQEYADGDPDPQTGNCTSISTQYHLAALPAFVVDVPTTSLNAKLSGEAKPDEK